LLLDARRKLLRRQALSHQETVTVDRY